ncbi:MAG: hypothetical protein A4E66_00731 [Syntrophus sp. PtaB.Bin001]|nr:MAG: hypothetical protein A4E66_00731 [Syntrophus sp. PtaB.Bin001]
MSDKDSVVAQTDINIQGAAPRKYAGGHQGCAVLPAGNLQIFKLFGKQPGEMKSRSKPHSFRFLRRRLLPIGKKIMNAPGENEILREVGKGDTVNVGMAVINLDPALARRREYEAFIREGKGKFADVPFSRGTVLHINGKKPGYGRNTWAGLADCFICGFLGSP